MAVSSDYSVSWNQNLISQPWQPFSIDGNQYIVKAIFEESALCHEFCISDFKKIWYEKIESEKFKALSTELNPNVEAETLYLMKHVYKNIVSQQVNTTYQIIQEDNKLQLQLKTKLQPGVSYAWCFNCQRTDEHLVSQVLIEPLVTMVAELLRRQNELQALIHKKDMEIQDYKESEVKLSRKSLGTTKFDDESFSKQMSHSSGFGHVVTSASRLAFTEPAQELYKQVQERRTWLQSRDSKEETYEDGLRMPWDDNSPNVSPYTSPQKTTTTVTTKPVPPVDSPSKDRELQRREELRRKLDEEAERKKRKKKKIKL